MRWSDAADIGSPGFGLLDELERRGLDVAADEYFRCAGHRPPRPGRAAEADAQIHLATGGYIDAGEPCRRRRGRRVRPAHRRASAPRPPRCGRVHRPARPSEGLGELVPLIDTNLFGMSVDTRLSAADHADLAG